MKTPVRPGATVHGIDRMIRNVETGRFERSLSGLTAIGALVTAAEIYFRTRQGKLWQQTDVDPCCPRPGRSSGRRRRGVQQADGQNSAPAGLRRDCRQRPAGDVPARPRHRAEARAVFQPALQHGDGSAAAGPAAGDPGGRHGPAGGRAEEGKVSGAATGPEGRRRPLPRLQRPGPVRTLGPGDARRRPGPPRPTGGPAVLHPRRGGSRQSPVRPAAGPARGAPCPGGAMVDCPAGRGPDRRLALRGHATGRRRPGAAPWRRWTPRPGARSGSAFAELSWDEQEGLLTDIQTPTSGRACRHAGVEPVDPLCVHGLLLPPLGLGRDRFCRARLSARLQEPGARRPGALRSRGCPPRTAIRYPRRSRERGRH